MFNLICSILLATTVMAHPWCLAGKCIPGAGGEQDGKGAELDVLAFREQ